MEQAWSASKRVFFLMLSAPLFWLIVFFLIPMGIIWLYSFGENSGLIDIRVTGSWTNYTRALDPLYLGIFGKSLLMAGVTTLACILIGFPVALGITFAPDRQKSWLLLLIMLPFWTNLLIRTYALISVLAKEGYVNVSLNALHDGLNVALGSMGMHPLGAFTPLSLLYNDVAIQIGLVAVNLPFMILPLYSTLDRMDRSLLEASLDLGAGHLRTLFNVVVPLAAPGIASGILITFIPALGSYLTPDLLGGRVQMIANVIEAQFLRANDWPFGAALSFILVYLTLFGVAI